MKGAIFLFFFLFVVKALYPALRSQKCRETPLFAVRKSYVALKSQANALTFVFLSGLILSQSLIIAYNFTNSPIKFGGGNTSFGSPTGFAVADLNSSGAQPENTIAPEPFGALGAGVVAENSVPPEVVPLAQDNSQLQAPDAGNINENVSSEIPPAPPENIIVPANDTSMPPENLNSEADANVTESNSLGSVSNDTNVVAENPVVAPVQNTSLSPENASLDANVSEPVPVALPLQNESSDNIPAGNMSGNATLPQGSPRISLIVNIGDIKRGEAFNLYLQITNTGSADAANVILALELPQGISGEQTKAVGTITTGASVNASFTLTSSLDTALGLNQIRVRAAYE